MQALTVPAQATALVPPSWSRAANAPVIAYKIWLADGAEDRRSG